MERRGKEEGRSRIVRPERTFRSCTFLSSSFLAPPAERTQSGFSKLTFAPTVTSIPLPSHGGDTTQATRNAWYARLASREKPTEHLPVFLSLSLVFSFLSPAPRLSSLGLSRRTVAPYFGVTRFYVMNHRSRVRMDFRLENEASVRGASACARAAYRASRI